MKKQRGFTFLELMVAVVVLVLGVLITLGMFARASLTLKKNTELSKANLLAQKVMERTIYQTGEEIQTNSVTVNPSGNNFVNFAEERYKDYKYKIRLGIPADPALSSFSTVEVTVKTPLGAEVDLVGLAEGEFVLPKGTCLVVRWDGDRTSLWIKYPGEDLQQITNWTDESVEGSGVAINQAALSRDGKYIFVHKTGLDNKSHLYMLNTSKINNLNYMSDPNGWEELDTGVWTGFSISPVRDEMVYIKQEGENFKSIKMNYRTGAKDVIYSMDVSNVASWNYISDASTYAVNVQCPTPVCNPVFSPDGNKIALSFQDNGGSLNKLNTKIGYYDVEIGNVVILDSHEGDRAEYQDFFFSKPAWSPDGQKLSYSFFDWSKGAKQKAVLYTLNINNPSSRNILYNAETGYNNNGTPQLSDDDFTYDSVYNGIKSVWIDNEKVAYTYLAPRTYTGTNNSGDPVLVVKKTSDGSTVFSNAIIVSDGSIPYDVNPYYNGQAVEFLDTYNGYIIVNVGWRGENGVKIIKSDGTGGFILFIPHPGTVAGTFLQSIKKQE